MKELIAIVDDEPDILELVSINLKRSGFNTREFLSARELYSYMEKNVPDLIVLDLMLPDIDGIEVCKNLKSNSKYASIPIIMLTARTEESDRVLGLEIGADDYITKPFSPRELAARVKAVLRRGNVSEEKDMLNINDIITIDLQKYEVFVNGEPVSLTTTEFKILEAMAKRKGWVFSRNKLLDHLWGDRKFVLDRTIDVHIKHLRTKLGEAGKLIKNIRGVGYKLG